MRIVTWNCRQGLSKAKEEALLGLRPDIAVVAELRPDYQPPAGWSLSLRRTDWPRVLGVLARPGLRLVTHPQDPALPWLLPLQVNGPGVREFTLLALWTLGGIGRPSYERQVEQAVTAWDAAAGPVWQRVVLAGDLNVSMQSQPVGHRRNLDALAERGMVSSYHRASGCPHGGEAAQTLRWVGRGGVATWFHCDFIFVSSDLLPGLTAAVGAAAAWVAPGMSDHAPVLAALPELSV